MGILELESVRLERERFVLDLSLRLEYGQTGVIVGPSGSGKSTLLRIIAGFIRPRSGIQRLSDRDISRLAPEKRRIGMVFQGDALFPSMTVRANIEYGPRIAGVIAAERRRRVAEIASSFGMIELLDRMPSGLSGGEKKRVALARSLAAEPELMLFDEALSSLDPSSRRTLAGEIARRTRGAGLSSLHVTHDAAEALELADKIFVMEKGRIVENGSPEEVYERPQSVTTARFFSKGPLIPIVGWEGRLARSDAGVFGPEVCSAEAQAAQQSYVHFPSSAARILPKSDIGLGARNAFAARIVGLSYRGFRWEINTIIVGTNIELGIEHPPGLSVAADEIIGIRVSPADIRILH